MARKLAMATRGKQGPDIKDLCYLAGVIDSDGCLSITKNKAGIKRIKNPRYVFCMNITNTSKELMNWLEEKFGGRYGAHRKRLSEKHKVTYDWRFSNGKALWLLELIEPLLVVKGAQARIGIQLLQNWKTNNGGVGSSTDDQEVTRRELCYQQIKELNKFGPVQPQRLSPLAPI